MLFVCAKGKRRNELDEPGNDSSADDKTRKALNMSTTQPYTKAGVCWQSLGGGDETTPPLQSTPYPGLLPDMLHASARTTKARTHKTRLGERKQETVYKSVLESVKGKDDACLSSILR